MSVTANYRWDDEPTEPRVTDLQRCVATLKPGDYVRVHLNHRDEPVTGTLRLPKHSKLLGPHTLFLDVPEAHLVRDSRGLPGFAIRGVERVEQDAANDEERWFDDVCDAVEVYLQKYVAHRDCPKSEEPWREVEMHQAKRDVIDRFYRAGVGS